MWAQFNYPEICLIFFLTKSNKRLQKKKNPDSVDTYSGCSCVFRLPHLPALVPTALPPKHWAWCVAALASQKLEGFGQWKHNILKLFLFFNTAFFFFSILLWPRKMQSSCQPQRPFTLWFSASLGVSSQEECLLAARHWGKTRHLRKSLLSLNIPPLCWVNRSTSEIQSLIKIEQGKVSRIFYRRQCVSTGTWFLKKRTVFLAYSLVKASSVL